MGARKYPSCKQFKVSNLNWYLYSYMNQYQFLYTLILISPYSIVQSFEVVVYLYAQQLPLDEQQNFTLPLLTLVAELVNKSLSKHNNNH